MTTKSQLIEAITSINRSATVEFLMSFDLPQLRYYLEHLEFMREPRGRESVWVRPGDTPAIVSME